MNFKEIKELIEILDKSTLTEINIEDTKGKVTLKKEKEKKIPRAVLIDAIEAALITAYKKNYDSARNVRVELNMDQGTFKVIARKDVV
ncbi:NusA N-terminal domain-containing protein, partial [Staphylococcus aureus]|uniref:NusA N-terminal domain-containing protein n=1 Tax=Staphylococcus aureus TaxID=1280 RepID=UPI002412B71E